MIPLILVLMLGFSTSLTVVYRHVAMPEYSTIAGTMRMLVGATGGALDMLVSVGSLADMVHAQLLGAPMHPGAEQHNYCFQSMLTCSTSNSVRQTIARQNMPDSPFQFLQS